MFVAEISTAFVDTKLIYKKIGLGTHFPKQVS